MIYTLISISNEPCHRDRGIHVCQQKQFYKQLKIHKLCTIHNYVYVETFHLVRQCV